LPPAGRVRTTGATGFGFFAGRAFTIGAARFDARASFATVFCTFAAALAVATRRAGDFLVLVLVLMLTALRAG
jgi:hypothetical protein